MSKLTIISHFYNEEYLLPWWLEHHKNIFDDGIMIDYNSTDSSVDIISNICPNWKIVRSRNQYFDAPLVDQEVMDYESEIDGIKVCLNTTEFLIANTASILEQMQDKACLQIKRICMIDVEPETVVDKKERLVDKKTSGFCLENARLPNLPPYRYIHKHKNGKYDSGRHSILHYVDAVLKEPIFLYGKYSPWTQQTIDRRLAIKNKIPEHNVRCGMGIQHMASLSDIIEEKNHFEKNINIENYKQFAL